MKSTHFFVSFLDLAEQLSFSVKPSGAKSLGKADNAFKALSDFIKMMEKNCGNEFYYVGQDVISEKLFHRFLFKDQGFVEFMLGTPSVISAHFVDKKNARVFASCLKTSLKQVLPKGLQTTMALKNIVVQSVKDEMIGFNTWNTMKSLRDLS